MPKIDYNELTSVSGEVTELRLKIVSQFKSFNQAHTSFKQAEKLSGTGWDSARNYFEGYTTVSDAIFNALYEVDDTLKNYLSAFTSEVGAAENRLDTDKMEELKEELRRLQAENNTILEAAAKAFEDVPIVRNYLLKQSMYGTARKIEILEKYQAFEAAHGSDFASLQTVISSIDQGLAFLGNSGNFTGGINGYKGVAFAEQDWFKNLKEFNELNHEDRYEIVVIQEDHEGQTFAVYKHGKIDWERTNEYNKLLAKQQWELLLNLGPEVFKILVGLDDVEILLDDGSSSGQKVQANIFLILSVTPVDKIKDIIKAAKTLNKGENLLDGVKLSAESLEALKKMENSGETVKIIDKSTDFYKQFKLSDLDLKLIEQLEKNGYSRLLN